MDSVREAILYLNELNVQCDDCLIGTMERGGICGAIIDLCQTLSSNDTGENYLQKEKKKNIFYTFIPPGWLQFQTAADNQIRCQINLQS